MSELIYQALFCFVIIAMYAIQAIYLIAMAVPIVLYLLIALAAAIPFHTTPLTCFPGRCEAGNNPSL